jgi:uncharacterized surface protein with fasciclin (FAS1) repeats
MKIKNQILKIMLVAFTAVLTFSCSNEDDNKEVIVPLKSILDIAKADPNFSILVAAIKKTGLDIPGNSPLSAAGSYTVFAPTNAAFLSSTTFTEANINALTAPADNVTIAALKQVVLNHILGTGIRADDLLVAGYVKTFAPAIGTTTMSMYVNQVGSDVLVNGGSTNSGAKVTTPNIAASNGIIHVVDAVIGLPTILNHAKANPNFATLVSVVNSTSGTYGDQTAVKNALIAATNALPLTVFAPSNDAFTNALNTTSGFIPAAPTSAQVSTLLYYHVTAGNKTRSTLTEGLVLNSKTTPVQTFKTLIAGVGGLRIEDKGAITPTIKNISILKITDVQAINGVIHSVDKVLQPVL